MNERQIKWIEFVISVVILCVGVVTFSYSTFATKEGVKDSIVGRLDRIENKLDRLIESNPRQ
jgi:hypothetical protein